jgi:preprotein translocase subunit SecD
VRRFLPILIILLGLMAIWVDHPGARFIVLNSVDAGITQPVHTKLGLDLKGGFSITYQAVVGKGQTAPTSAQMETIRSIMERRVNTTGVSEPIVQTAAGDRVIVSVPGVNNPKAIADLVGQTGLLQFVLLPPSDYGTHTTPGAKAIPLDNTPIDPVLLTVPANVPFTGADLDPSKIQSRYDSQGSPAPGWVVDFAFAGTKAADFNTWSGAHVDDYFAIVLDGTVISAPYIKGAINGTGTISGGFTGATDSGELATILQYGALPYVMADQGHVEVPASLGKAFLNQTLLAGFIGIALVLLFMLIYYRLPGLVACFALGYYTLVVYAIFRIVPVTLTLAGIAGFVLSVGMAVDANILIFERTKEELRAGKTLVSAVEAGFNRALNSIIDSNVSTLITAFILYFFGSPTIQGFALVLIVGVLTSMFTAVVVSRTALRFVVHQSVTHRAWLFGVSEAEFKARALPGQRSARREARGRV